MRFFHRVAMLSACLPIAIAMSACSQPTPSEPAATPAAAPAQSPAERGKVLVQVGGCHDCHTTKKAGAPDMTTMLSGHPASIKVPAPPKVPGWKPVGHPDDGYANGVEWPVGHHLRREPDAGPRHRIEKQRMV